jgi:uncharacterized C2H2 Zn-finger protein
MRDLDTELPIKCPYCNNILQRGVSAMNMTWVDGVFIPLETFYRCPRRDCKFNEDFRFNW